MLNQKLNGFEYEKEFSEEEESEEDGRIMAYLEKIETARNKLTIMDDTQT